MQKNHLSIALIALLNLIAPINACVVSVKNDGPAKILVIDMNDHKAVEVQKGKTKRVGNPHKLAYCKVYTKKPKAHTFGLRFEFKQNECAGNGKPIVKLSDLEGKTDAVKLFTVIDYQQVAVQVAATQLDDQKQTQQNQGCTSCGN